MNKLITVITVLLFSITSTFAQEVTSPKFGKGLIDIKGKDDSFSMNVSARMQYLTSSSWSESD